MDALRNVRKKMLQVWPHLNERSRRIMAAAEAVQFGYGGVSIISQACGLSRVTLTKGIKGLGKTALSPERIRHPGGGHKSLTMLDP